MNDPLAPVAALPLTRSKEFLDWWHDVGRYEMAADDATERAFEAGRAIGEKQLRQFAQSVMKNWPLGDVDGGELQAAAIESGLIELKVPAPTEPCGESCACAGYYADDEWQTGVECYRRTALLTGAPIAPDTKP